jgi:hypothetical protein
MLKATYVILQQYALPGGAAEKLPNVTNVNPTYIIIESVWYMSASHYTEKYVSRVIMPDFMWVHQNKSLQIFNRLIRSSVLRLYSKLQFKLTYLPEI